MKLLKTILGLLSAKEKKRGSAVLLMVVGMALLEAAGVASVMPFLAILGSPEMIESNAFLQKMYVWAEGFGVKDTDAFLMLLGVAALLLIFVSAVYRVLTHYVMNRFIEMRRNSIGVRLLDSYLSQPYSFFLNRHSGEMSKTILSEVDQFVGQILRPVITMVAYSFVLMSLIALLILANPKLTLIVAGVFFFMYGIIYLACRSHLSRIGALRIESNEARFVMAAEIFNAIKVIKLTGQESVYFDRFKEPSKLFAYTQASHQTFNQAPKYIIEAIAFGCILLLTLVLLNQYGGAQGGALGQILPILGLYAFAAYRIQPAATSIYQGIASLHYGAAAIEELHRESYLSKDVSSELAQSALLIAQKNIELQDVCYQYPESDRLTLEGIDISIPVGSTVGLIGTTGAGKTTLVDIILGLLEPSSGAILVDGSPITSLNRRAWQKNLGYVPQEIFLTHLSIAENIALGIAKEDINYDQVERCARMAQMHDFIFEELPERYNTMVGERGVRLSGGQRQRIGIARALYHDPEVLVFDEATSALDSTTEQTVMKAINNLYGKKTIIMIAHRMSTLRKCDNVVMLERGKVKSQGSFEEVVEVSNKLQSLVNN